MFQRDPKKTREACRRWREKLAADPDRAEGFREKWRAAARERHRRNYSDPVYREKIAARNKKWASDNPDKVAESRRKRILKHRYGLSIGEYESLLASQDWACAICRRTSDQRGYAFSVDHDHDTGATRGILCNNCNTMIGLASESAETLASAIDYLNAFKEAQRLVC